jgi:2-dehydro-3-deoxy-D-arabinonate dehydratase
VSRTDPPPLGLQRVVDRGRPTWILRDPDGARAVPIGLAGLLALPLSAARAVLDTSPAVDLADDLVVLPPVDEQEVWAAGVTYARSRDERMAESRDPTIYDRIYEAERPELFFKSPATRVLTTGDAIGIRADSAWNVPEAELGVVVNRYGEVFGYVVGNDVSSRSIEGENPLYLPQAKYYDRSCALGPSIVPAWTVAGPFDIALSIDRAGAHVFAGRTSSAAMARPVEELVAWLIAALEMPAGAVLLTGTGIVPEEDVTLQPDDVVTIDISEVGRLVNPVQLVGPAVPPARATSGD